MLPEKYGNENLIPDLFQTSLIKKSEEILYYFNLVKIHRL